MGIQRYLKTGSEFARGMEVIQRNTDIVQAASTPVCGHLCLFVLKSLTSGEQFQSILNHMHRKVIGKIPSKPEKGFILPKHRFTGPTTHYTCNWIHKIIHYRETNHTMLLMLFLRAMTYAIEIIRMVNMNVTVATLELLGSISKIAEFEIIHVS